MKFLTFNDHRLGLLVNGKIIDVKDQLKKLGDFNLSLGMLELIQNFDNLQPLLSEIDLSTCDYFDLDLIEYLPPITNPSKIICTVDNYPAHAAEDATEIFPKPIFFMKPNSVLLGSRHTVLLPVHSSRVDHELELAIIIGKTCRHVSSRDALSYVFGYSIFLDMSARDFRTIPYSWFSMKGWDTFGPLGPYIVTGDEIGDPQNLDLKLWVNGNQRMIGNTRDMIFSIGELIESISEVTTLLPGDIIATGTIEGIAPVFEGDIVIAQIQNIGKLEVSIERSKSIDKWHDLNFSQEYAHYRERDSADRGADPMAPKGSDAI